VIDGVGQVDGMLDFFTEGCLARCGEKGFVEVSIELGPDAIATHLDVLHPARPNMSLSSHTKHAKKTKGSVAWCRALGLWTWTRRVSTL
jgi:hypothetical protein